MAETTELIARLSAAKTQLDANGVIGSEYVSALFGEALERLSAPVEGMETTEEERASLEAFMVEMGHTDDGETFALAQTASRLLRDFARLQAEVARLTAALVEADLWIAAALNMIDGNGLPPNWDGLRAFHKEIRALLPKTGDTTNG